jgi:hypothetical protein
LNKIPQRHLDFYYKDVLKIKPRDPVPDETFVVFELAKGFDQVEIKKGSKLSAGKDRKDRDIIYETAKDIVVNKAQVNALHQVFTERNAEGEVLNYYKTAISHQATKELPGMGTFKIFGRSATSASADVGFAISSSQLYLAKGERKVNITFQSPVALQPCTKTGTQGESEAFSTDIIRLMLTGEEGWINSDDPDSYITIESLKKIADATVELIFHISITQEQAIIAYDEKLHAGYYNTAFPILQVILKYPALSAEADADATNAWKQKIDQLCMLQKLQLISTKIHVEVGSINAKLSFDGVRDLILENDESILDHSKPFFPFTAVPKVGSSLYIGCKDLFYKKIDDLSINMEWVLPDNFSTYYQRYLPPYDSNKFTASLSVLNAKRWNKLSNVSVIDAGSADPRFRSIKINLDKFRQTPANAPADRAIPTFDNTKDNGTLRLKLNYPDFGHSIYPQLITTMVMEKAGAKSEGVDYYKVVKRQLRDSVISIKLPDDISNPTGSLRVIYHILGLQQDNSLARTQLIKALSEILRRYNQGNLIAPAPPHAGEAPREQEEETMIVNDENFIERILRFLKRVKLVDKDIHYDENRQDVDDVADEIKESLNKRVDFIMPSDKELVNLIVNETNAAINKTVTNIVDEILALKLKEEATPERIADLLKTEFDEVNEVINDMIARKIAIHISANEIPPPPYTPLVSTLSVSYASGKVLSETDGDKIFRISPLGVSETDLLNLSALAIPEAAGATVNRVFKEYIITDDTRLEGMFFIGISGLVPPQNLSMLFHVAQGTRMNDKKPPDLHWYYLSKNNWMALSSDAIISDGTYGLQTTGVIELSVPGDITASQILFDDPKCYWLCAGVGNNPDAFPQLVNVNTQAVTVVFKHYKENPEHLALPLESGKIKTFVDEMPQLKKVMQPVSSFSGKQGESDDEYYMRVSERLRHKSRVINNWDYERLVLEEFSSIYKVKCLNNYYKGEFATGHITVVPIADLRNKTFSGSHLLLPKLSYIELRKVEEFLATKSSPFVNVHAVNPQLEQVLINCKVRFHGHVDKGFYLQRLNQDLVNFLTPWAGGNPDAVTFSGKIYFSSIINFIDGLDYVDYLVDLVMQQYTVNERGEKDFVRNEEQLTALIETELKTAHSILVSAPKHNIELVE